LSPRPSPLRRLGQGRRLRRLRRVWRPRKTACGKPSAFLGVLLVRGAAGSQPLRRLLRRGLASPQNSLRKAFGFPRRFARPAEGYCIMTAPTPLRSVTRRRGRRIGIWQRIPLAVPKNAGRKPISAIGAPDADPLKGSTRGAPAPKWPRHRHLAPDSVGR